MITTSLAGDGVLRRNLARSMDGLRRASARLGSGLRITRAADDPAGLAIAENLDASVRGKRAAVRNLNDALSAAAFAAGGLSEIADKVKRLRELAVQAASETLDDDERAYVEQEYQGVLVEINRIAVTTSWGDQPLLSEFPVMVGFVLDLSASMAGELDALKAALSDFRATIATAGLGVGLGIAGMGTDLLDGATMMADIGVADFDQLVAGVDVVGTAAMDPWSALLNVSGVADLPGSDDPDAFSFREDSEKKVLVLVTDTGVERNVTGSSASDVGTALADAGIEVHTINQSGHDGTFSPVTSATGGSTWDMGGGQGSNIGASLDAIAATLSGAEPPPELQIQANDRNRDEDRLPFGLEVDATATGLGIADSSVATVDEAREALDALDGALTQVGRLRAGVGATMNRIGHALAVQERTILDLESARSRILDADMAVEAAAMAKHRILADLGMSVLAQSRKLARDAVLSLL